MKFDWVMTSEMLCTASLGFQEHHVAIDPVRSVACTSRGSGVCRSLSHNLFRMQLFYLTNVPHEHVHLGNLIAAQRAAGVPPADYSLEICILITKLGI